MRSILIVSSVALVVVACSFSAPEVPPGALTPSGGSSGDGTGEQGGSATAGSGGSSVAGAGSTSSGGSVSGGAAGAGGAGAAGSDPTGSGGSASGAAGTGSAGSGTGGSSSGGSNAGSSGAGGTDTTTPSDAGTKPPTPEASTPIDSGAASAGDVGKALEGLRIDDPCGAVSGSTCAHVTQPPPYHNSKAAKLGGTAGTTYNVTLRVRGVVEVNDITGGTQPDTKVPFNVGGVPTRTDYERWTLVVGSPAQTYHLNQFHETAHVCKVLDYTVTVPIEGGASVTVDAYDSNDHLILYSGATQPPGVSPGIKQGQFVQLSVVSAQAK